VLRTGKSAGVSLEDIIATPTPALDPSAQPSAASVSATNGVLVAMLRVSDKVSDLIFSPGRPPQVELNGQLAPVEHLPVLSADDTRRVAGDLIGNNKQAMTKLREQGACDISYSLPGSARFRVNIFIQRGTCG